MSNVTATGGFGEWQAPTRIILRDGSVWTPGADQIIGTSDASKSANAKWSLLCVTGATSRVNAANTTYSLNIRSEGNGFFVQDGAAAYWKNLYIGGTYCSKDCIASVDGATMVVGDTIHLGSSETSSGVNTTSGSELEVKGANAQVTAENLLVYKGTKPILTFGVPVNGWDAAPLRVTSFTSTGSGANDGTLKIAWYAWARQHSEETVPLMRFENAAAASAALAEITNTVEWVDRKDLIAAGTVPHLSLSDDGKTLYLTAPEIHLEPTVTVTAETGPALGTKTIKFVFTDYGAESKSITDIWCKYADYPGGTFSSPTNFLADLPPISSELPCTVSFVLKGDFVQHQQYQATFQCDNDGNTPVVKELVFEGDPLAENLRWKESAVSGQWHDKNYWTMLDAKGQETAANTYPHAEDTITYISNEHDVTISLNDDAEAVAVTHARTNVYSLVFALNGNTLTLNAPYRDSAESTTWNPILRTDYIVDESSSDFGIPGARIVIQDGTLVATNSSSDGVTCGSGIMLGEAKALSSGFLDVNHATNAAAIPYFNNSSRVCVREGGELTLAENGLRCDLILHSHTAVGANPILCVTGANSRVTYPQNDVCIRGYDAACYVQQGASIVSRTFTIGGTNYCAGTGTDGVANRLYSTNTHVHVENALIDVGQDLEMGWYDDASCVPRLVVNGAKTSVRIGGALRIHEDLSASLEFEFPKEAISEALVVAKSLESVPRPEGNADYGRTTLWLRGAKAWSRAHPKEVATLVQLETPNGAALTNLMKSVRTDWPLMPRKCLSVAGEGRILQFKAPPPLGLTVRVR